MNVRALARGCATATLGLALLAATGRAQSAQLFSLQASGLAANFKEQAGNSAVGGFGVEAMARINPAAWSVGVGYQRTVHALSSAETLLMTGFFIEPRYAIDVHSDRVAPYIAGRVGKLDALDTFTGQADVKLKCTVFGAGAGLIVRWTPRVNVDIGAAITQNKFEGNPTFTGYVAKAGLSLGLGNR